MESKNRNGMMVYLTETEFKVLHNYLQGFNIEMNEIRLHQEKLIGFKIKHPVNELKNKTFYDMKFKIGTDEFDFGKDIKEVYELILDAASIPKSGYTTKLKEELTTKEPFLRLHTECLPSMSPFIFVKCGREFSNVKCFDIESSYPYLLTQPLPHFKRFIDTEYMDLEDKNKTYYVGLKLYNLRAKTHFLSLSFVGDDNTVIADGQYEGQVVRLGTRIISVDKVVIYGFLPFLLEALEDYDYDKIEYTKQVAEYELKIDEDIRNYVLQTYYPKEAKKQRKKNGEDVSYQAEKIKLNRLYGFFITKGNEDAPAHYGQYIVQKGKAILNRIAHEIGFKDMIHGHTDSIKFVGDHEDVIKRYNDTIEFEHLGRFDYEGTMERVVYYGTNCSKYLMNGKLGLKHGGVPEEDLEKIYQMNYDDITKDTPYFRTFDRTYEREYGYYPVVKPCKFGGSV